MLSSYLIQSLTRQFFDAVPLVKSSSKILFSVLMLFWLGACTIAKHHSQIDQSFFAENGWGEGVAVVQHPAGEHVNGELNNDLACLEFSNFKGASYHCGLACSVCQPFSVC